MATTDDDLDFSEPWEMFADEDEPWKDLGRLLEWEEKMDTQRELGDAFGCSPSTISYWLGKAHDDPSAGVPDDQDNPCNLAEVCGNQAPGTKNALCNDCIDLFRHNQMLSERYKTKGLDADDYESLIEYTEALYDHYDLEDIR